MASDLVVLVLGAGPRVGSSVAEKFSQNGYKVAIASRSGKNGINDQGYLSLQADFTKPSTIPNLFEAVKSEFKTAPSVVVYNAAALTPPPDENSLFSISGDSVTSDLNVNTVSPYVAAQQAVIEWDKSPKSKKTFIYTGNILNEAVIPVPMFLNLGVGKAASAYWIGTADAVYSPKGYR
jgi:NAD(P)-dependent dehydrogenase (short-subunit alcohol dehydrogenase family)